MNAALVLGKFYPPHSGHLALIAEAMRVRGHVVVLCLGSAGDTYPPAARLAALLEDAAAADVATERITGRAGCDETPFDLDNGPVWDSHLEVFLAYLRDCPPVDLLVTSEAYGPELSRRLRLAHHGFDQARRIVPVSSSQLRRDLVAGWAALGPGTRRMLSTRVILLGAESTGTTTVAQGLARRLASRGGPWAATRWVPEYGHELTIAKQDDAERRTGERPLSVEWTPSDFLHVAEVQAAREEQAAVSGGPVLVCDTDSFATTVWERRYLGREAGRLPTTLGRGDVYLLTHHAGVPFVQDGSRDGAHLREAMTAEFADALVAANKPWAALTGTLEQRVALALRIADHTLRRRLTLAAPI